MNLPILPHDTIMHLKLGAPLALLLVAVILVAQHLGPGFAVAVGSFLLGVGVEMYQKKRREGVPSWGDAFASAAAGIVGGLAYEAWGAL